MSSEQELVPSGFTRVCGEERAGLVIVICIFALAIVGVVVPGMSWMVERKLRELREKREIVDRRAGADVGGDVGGMPYEKRAAEV